MSALDALFHLVNFVLPAIFVGGILALWGLRYSKRSARKAWLINSLVGTVTMLAGLVFFDFDGKMLSYAFLVVACSLAQLWQSRKN